MLLINVIIKPKILFLFLSFLGGLKNSLLKMLRSYIFAKMNVQSASLTAYSPFYYSSNVVNLYEELNKSGNHT